MFIVLTNNFVLIPLDYSTFCIFYGLAWKKCLLAYSLYSFLNNQTLKWQSMGGIIQLLCHFETQLPRHPLSYRSNSNVKTVFWGWVLCCDSLLYFWSNLSPKWGLLQPFSHFISVSSGQTAQSRNYFRHER